MLQNKHFFISVFTIIIQKLSINLISSCTSCLRGSFLIVEFINNSKKILALLESNLIQKIFLIFIPYKASRCIMPNKTYLTTETMHLLKSRWIPIISGLIVLTIPSVATANDPGLCLMVTSSGKKISLG